MMRGRTFVIIFLVGFGVLAVATTIARVNLQRSLGLNQAGIGLAKVQKAAAVWAERHNFAYPDHISLLQANNYFRRSLFHDPRDVTGTVWTVNGVDARPYLDEVLASHAQVPIDRTPLLDAIATLPREETPWYRFGDYYFVRLERFREHPDLIFGFTLPNRERERFVAFDDNKHLQVGPETWEAIWTRDARARASLGLEPIQPPPIDLGLDSLGDPDDQE